MWSDLAVRQMSVPVLVLSREYETQVGCEASSRLLLCCHSESGQFCKDPDSSYILTIRCGLAVMHYLLHKMHS